MEKKIVFPELTAVETVDGCTGCFGEKNYNPKNSYCILSSCVEKLLGVNCDSYDIIFIKPEKWEQCTMENTKVGDEVKHESRNQKLIVTYMFESGTMFIGKTSCGMEDLKQTSGYLVNTNR